LYSPAFGVAVDKALGILKSLFAFLFGAGGRVAMGGGRRFGGSLALSSVEIRSTTGDSLM